MDTKLIISNTNHIDLIGEKVWNNVDILIDNNKISEIRLHKNNENKNIYNIDGTGKFTLPGLFENHTHLTILTKQNDEVKEEILNECGIDSADGTLEELVLREFVDHGITQIRDLGGPVDTLKTMTENISNNKYTGPDIFYSGPMLQKYASADQGSNARWPGFNVGVDSESEAKKLSGIFPITVPRW